MDKKGNKKVKPYKKTGERKQNENPIMSDRPYNKIFTQNSQEKIGQCYDHKPIEIDGNKVVEEIQKIFERVSFLKVVSPNDGAEC